MRGRQRGVLAGATRLIAQRRVLNVLIEVNKLHSAAALRWEEEARKAYADNEEGGAGGQAWPENDAPLSDTDNDAATQDLIALVQVGGAGNGREGVRARAGGRGRVGNVREGWRARAGVGVGRAAEAGRRGADVAATAPAQTLLEAGYDVLSTDRCAGEEEEGVAAARPAAPPLPLCPSAPRRGWLRWQDPWGMGKADEAADLTSWARAVYEHEIDLWASLDATGGEPHALQLPPSGRGAQRGE